MLGSTINIPLYRTKSELAVVSDFADFWIRQFWGIPLHRMQQETVIALNVGGGLTPILLALYERLRSNAGATLTVAV